MAPPYPNRINSKQLAYNVIWGWIAVGICANPLNVKDHVIYQCQQTCVNMNIANTQGCAYSLVQTFLDQHGLASYAGVLLNTMKNVTH